MRWNRGKDSIIYTLSLGGRADLYKWLVWVILSPVVFPLLLDCFHLSNDKVIPRIPESKPMMMMICNYKQEKKDEYY